MFRLHPTAKMFFCLFFLFASVWYCRWEKNARNWCILQKKYKAFFFFFFCCFCNCPNSSMFFQIKLLFVRFCFLPKENMQKKEKKRLFLLLVTLALFFVVFFTHSETNKKSWLKLEKNAKLEDDGERETIFCVIEKKKRTKISVADRRISETYFNTHLLFFFFLWN